MTEELEDLICIKAMKRDYLSVKGYLETSTDIEDIIYNRNLLSAYSTVLKYWLSSDEYIQVMTELNNA
jgi:hypothetical protein